LTALAVENELAFEARVRRVISRRAAWSRARLVDEVKPTIGDIESWELHSELVLVCPEVCERARDLLPDRDPDAFLAETASQLAGAVAAARAKPSLPVAVLSYALWRLGETARSAFVAVGAVVALALFAEVLH
jgi:hypothetical protein